MKVWIIQRSTGCCEHFTTPCQVVRSKKEAEEWIRLQLYSDHYIKTEWDI